jgi:hypothetical protein
MKLKILFVVLFVGGFAASIALASPSGDGHGKRCSTTAATTTAATTTGTTTTSKRHGDDDDEHHGNRVCSSTTVLLTTGTTATTGTTTESGQPGCRKVELRGTLSAGTVSMSVDSTTAKRARSLAGTQVSLAVPAGPGRIQARLCTDAAGKQTLQLQSLKTGKSSEH